MKIFQMVAVVGMSLTAVGFVLHHAADKVDASTVADPPAVVRHVDGREAYLLQMRDSYHLLSTDTGADNGFMAIGKSVCNSLESGYTVKQLQRMAQKALNLDTKQMMLNAVAAAPDTLCQA